MVIDPKDKALIALLRANSRESTAELARKLNLSRSTVKDRMKRLENQGIITGYTVRFSESYGASHIKAHVMISSDSKYTGQIVRSLKRMTAVNSLYTVNGLYDMIAMVSAESTNILDQTLDDIGAMEGVEKTVTSIVLSVKWER